MTLGAELDRLVARLAALEGEVAALRTSSRFDGRKWLSTDEAAEYLGCPKSRIHKSTLAELPRHRWGGRVWFSVEDIDRLIAAGREGPPPAAIRLVSERPGRRSMS